MTRNKYSLETFSSEAEHKEPEREILPGVISEKEFQKIDKEQERLLIEISRLFPLGAQDHRIDARASALLMGGTESSPKGVFKKGQTQFVSVGFDPRHLYHDLISGQQQDYRLGNANVCGETANLRLAEDMGAIFDSMVIRRGDNVELVEENGKQVLRPAKNSSKNGNSKDRAMYTHIVSPCTPCRENICRHNQACTVILPRGYDHLMKLPAFAIYPDSDLFKKEDRLLEKLHKEGFEDSFIQAREMQRHFLRETAKRFPLTEIDRKLYEENYRAIDRVETTDRAYISARGLSVTGDIISSEGILPLPDKRFDRYASYIENPVETKFITDLRTGPHNPPLPLMRPGLAHSLYAFTELVKMRRNGEIRAVLPGALTRQRMVETFNRSFIITPLDGELAKIPFIVACDPNRYKRLDHQTERV